MYLTKATLVLNFYKPKQDTQHVNDFLKSGLALSLSGCCVGCSHLPDVYPGHHDPVHGTHGAHSQPALHQRPARALLDPAYHAQLRRATVMHVPRRGPDRGHRGRH